MSQYYHGKIIILDNVLSKEECEELIAFRKKSTEFQEWRGTRPMTIDLIDPFLLDKVSKITDSINHMLEEKIAVDWCELVEWPPGSDQDLHLDTASDQTVFTSITYLNDDYQGGRTYIKDDVEIIPKVGRTVCFDGNHYLHGVTLIEKGTRFTLPIWYKANEDQWIT